MKIAADCRSETNERQTFTVSFTRLTTFFNINIKVIAQSLRHLMRVATNALWHMKTHTHMCFWAYDVYVERQVNVNERHEEAQRERERGGEGEKA